MEPKLYSPEGYLTLAWRLTYEVLPSKAFVGFLSICWKLESANGGPVPLSEGAFWYDHVLLIGTERETTSACVAGLEFVAGSEERVASPSGSLDWKYTFRKQYGQGHPEVNGTQADPSDQQVLQRSGIPEGELMVLSVDGEESEGILRPVRQGSTCKESICRLISLLL